MAFNGNGNPNITSIREQQTAQLTIAVLELERIAGAGLEAYVSYGVRAHTHLHAVALWSLVDGI